MNIAAIVITYNDDFKFNEWVSHHQDYKKELYKHIIVDNRSNPDYLKMVENAFPDSLIIRRATNGGCTGAYNDGIRLALSDKKVDAIMLIGNDIKLEIGGVEKLCAFLFSDTEFGMVAPVLLAKDSEFIDDFGCELSKTLYMKPYDVGKNVSEVEVSYRTVASVTGGMNMAKREFYEKVGLQDDNLFMYSDEVDMALRSKKAGYKMAVTKEVKSWHQHINPTNSMQRPYYSGYLIGRNKVYLARKHFGIIFSIFEFFFLVFVFLRSFARSPLIITKLRYNLYFLLGAINGLLGNMRPNKFSKI